MPYADPERERQYQRSRQLSEVQKEAKRIRDRKRVRTGEYDARKKERAKWKRVFRYWNVYTEQRGVPHA